MRAKGVSTLVLSTLSMFGFLLAFVWAAARDNAALAIICGGSSLLHACILAGTVGYVLLELANPPGSVHEGNQP